MEKKEPFEEKEENDEKNIATKSQNKNGKSSLNDDREPHYNHDPHHNEEMINIFNSLLKNLDHPYITKHQLVKALQNSGILWDDPRIHETIENLKRFDDRDEINFQTFIKVIAHNAAIIEKTLVGNLVIPEFNVFTSHIKKIYDATKNINDGHVASYIPQLARVDPKKYAISICTIDGQRFSLGDVDDLFCVQSTCKPINYCMALEEHGEDEVHNHIGREPSGRGFNELTLNNEGLPHNPMINSGAIMACSLIRPDLDISDRFDYVLKMWQKLSGNFKPGFNNPTYLSEKKTADRNFALGYFIREKGAFPENAELIEILEFYFQCCSIELNCDAFAVVAATLANAGICPMTNERVFKTDTVKNCLSLLYSCGMYDFSGEFAFKVGLPAKSGVSGTLLLIIPNVMGISIWSPPLDKLGNTVRGIEFCKKFVETFNFHNYDAIATNVDKLDPRIAPVDIKLSSADRLIWAASQGDIGEINRLIAKGVDINEKDYDSRTALHLASSEGHVDIVDYLLGHGANANAKDRWGNTPIDDAKRENNSKVIEAFKKHGATI